MAKQGMSLGDVVNGAVGSMGDYCMGYMNPGASGDGYIATMKLSVDKVNVEGLDPGAEGIVSYDRCEKDDAYIGQINMGTASSFCGVNGALWGYHLAEADNLRGDVLFEYPGPLYPPDEKLPTQGAVPVYAVAPLLDAAERLFGRMDKTGDGQTDLRRFEPLPGAHVICANKDASALGPGYFWSIIGIAMAEDRDTQANLFIEDADVIPATPGINPTGETLWSPTPDQVTDQLTGHMANVAKSMVLCGQDQDVVYTEIFMGAKFIFAGPEEWGCALTCAPYVTLGQNAVSALSQPADLVQMSIDQWEQSAGLSPMPPAPTDPYVGGFGVSYGEN